MKTSENSKDSKDVDNYSSSESQSYTITSLVDIPLVSSATLSTVNRESEIKNQQKSPWYVSDDEANSAVLLGNRSPTTTSVGRLDFSGSETKLKE